MGHQDLKLIKDCSFYSRIVISRSTDVNVLADCLKRGLLKLWKQEMEKENCNFIESTTSDGQTLLIIASALGLEFVVNFLIENGADVNKTCEQGKMNILIKNKENLLFTTQLQRIMLKWQNYCLINQQKSMCLTKREILL